MVGWRIIPGCGMLDRLKTRNHPCPSLPPVSGGREGQGWVLELRQSRCDGTGALLVRKGVEPEKHVELTVDGEKARVFTMKKGIEIPDDLLIEAKKVAAEERSYLKKLVEVSLRKEMVRRKKSRSRGDRRIRWVTVPDELPRDLDVADRETVHEWVEIHTMLWQA
jgi:hypothetical protein